MSLLKIQKIACDADAATKSASAFDLEDMPEQFKCPICFEVPCKEIYQCANGHTVCKSCYDKKPSMQCAQCRTSMTSGGGGPLIRSRVLEELLDQVLIACPFRKNGCLETFSRQMDIKGHVDNCVKDGNCVQLCHHLGFQQKCDYWSRTTKPLQIVEHLTTNHKLFSTELREYTWRLPNFQNIIKKKLAVATPSPISICRPMHHTAFGGHFLVRWLLNQKDRTVSFMGIRIDDKPEDQIENEFEFNIDSHSAMMLPLKWKVPAMPILNLGEMLQQPPMRFSADVLEKHYLTEDGTLVAKITVKHGIKQWKRKHGDSSSSDSSDSSD